jgi:hypothetical protein
MSLRTDPVTVDATLPDGRVVAVRIAVPDDSYIAREELDTVVAELVDEATGEPLGVVSTILEVDDHFAARALARDIAEGLEAGKLEPTAGSIEPLAERRPDL